MHYVVRYICMSLIAQKLTGQFEVQSFSKQKKA